MKWKRKKWSVNQLNNRRSKIDLQPGFQRGPIWKKKRKQIFLDSVFKGWKIPKIYLRLIDERDDDYQCIDGQQRINTIYEFLRGKLILDENTLENEKKYKDLTPTQKDKIDEFKFDIDVVSKASDEEVGEIFLRLNSGAVVNSAEKLKSIGGGMKNFVWTLSKNKFLSDKTVVRNTRDAFISIAAQTCLLEVKGTQNVKFNDLKKFFDNNKSFNNRSKKAKKIKRVYKTLNKIFDIKTKEIKNRASVISLYLLISQLLDQKALTNKEKVIKGFFIDFQRKLGAKDIKDFHIVEYQNKVIQAQDNKKSIVTRDNILKLKLCQFDKLFYSYFPDIDEKTPSVRKPLKKESLEKIIIEICKLMKKINKKTKKELFRNDNERIATLYPICKNVRDYNYFCQGLGRWINEMDKKFFISKLDKMEIDSKKCKEFGTMQLIEIILARKLVKNIPITITRDLRDVNLLACSFARHGGKKLENQRDALLKKMGLDPLNINFEYLKGKTLKKFLSGLQDLYRSKAI